MNKGCLLHGRMVELAGSRSLFGTRNLISGEWESGTFHPKGIDCVIF
jgi:hypothetical protein